MALPTGQSSSSGTQVAPIPEPPGLPWFGNVGEFKSEDSIQDLARLHDTYGEIFRLHFPDGKSYIIAGSNRLVNEICDEGRFQKSLNSELSEVRHLANDGLFTAKTGEENWGIAHRILMPVFGPVAIREMFDEMHDIAIQLALKWARHGSSTPISAADDFTRLALDTIALCSMDFRFNSFYGDTLHPFVDSMADVLIESGKRFMRPALTKVFYRTTTKKFFKDVKKMRDISDRIVQSRRVDVGNKRKDLLAAMMNGVDLKTGQKMSDRSITDNLITFLIAGHETTSGTLSFLFYELMQNPKCYDKAQKEVDEVMGRGPITVEKIFKLKYIPAALRETLRLCSPIPGFAVEPLEDTLLGNKYPVHKGEAIIPLLALAHLDPVVYGENARDFEPERMLDENFERLQVKFPNCWKPFGHGVRACIGRPFAWQEMLLAVSLLLQNFNLTLDDPRYRLRLLETLTIKPKDLNIRASLRHGMSPLEFERRLRGASGGSSLARTDALSVDSCSGNPASARGISVFYGSNGGTCEALARRLAVDASCYGFHPRIVETLDTARDNLPTDHPVVIITSSYEGNPPDNAVHFVAWLRNLTGKPLKNVSYAIFGVGNREWASTFHIIPKLVDAGLAKHGAKRLATIGLTDTLDMDTFSDFESWEDRSLWPALENEFSSVRHTGPTHLSVSISASRSYILGQGLSEAIITASRSISSPGVPRKKHIEIKLPASLTYRAGDYLCVLPVNPRETVTRLLRRLKLSWDSLLTIQGEGQVAIPKNQPIMAWSVFSFYVELSQPATKRNISVLVQFTTEEDTMRALGRLAGEHFKDEITKKRVSVIDLLERFPSIDLPLESLLSMLFPIRIRQYSISSSPLKDAHHASVSYSILDEPSLSGQGRHIGVATSYLSHLSVGDIIHITIRSSHVAFHLPLSPETTPIICIAAGTGIGPFRGFIQERAMQLAAGRSLAPALLFFGCRGSADDLYREEFDEYEKQGAVVVKRAYSRESSEETAGCKHVQHRLLKDKEEVGGLWEQGGKIFVCGRYDVGKAVENACVELFKHIKEMDDAEANAFLEEVRNKRFVSDIFT